ncbi:MAG TPA: ABC transporter substrate-binding protein [Homoserinimonas sp.]|nr:ABC transporter substrate-binding protein [Homoserinimonas sp.]
MYRKNNARRGWALRATVAGAAALALTLTACSGGSSEAPEAEAERGGNMVTVLGFDPETLNPGLTTSNDTAFIVAQVFEALVWSDADGKPQPLLAESWEVSDDELTYTFSLRDGVTWHDGEPFTSADVKWTFETGLENNARAQTALKHVAAIDTPDDLTVVITLDTPQAAFLTQMKVFDTPIMPKHVYDGTDINQNPANQAPIGTGPFVFAEWDHGSAVTLEANEDYWDEGLPYLDSITFSVMSDAAQRTIALQTGQADFVGAFYLARADVEALEADENMVVRKQTTIPSLHFMQMNHENEYLGDKKVRQALAYAIDRERIVEQAMSGLAVAGKGSFGNGFPWMYNEDVSYDKLYPFDPEKAKELLEDAGVPEGTNFRVTYDASKVHFQAAGAIIKDNLKQVGIEVTLQPMEASVYKDNVYTNRDFDLAIQSFTSSGDPAIGYHRIYVSTPTNEVNKNATGYSNPEVDELLDKAASVSDFEERGEFYKQAQEILNEDIPTLILFDELQADAAGANVEGLFVGVNPMDQWKHVYLTK